MDNSLRQSQEYTCYMSKKGWLIENIKLKIPNSKKERNSLHSGARRDSDDALKYRPEGLYGNKKSSVNAFVKKIPLLGSVIKIQRPSVIPSEKALDNLAQKHRALFVKIEPTLPTTSHSEANLRSHVDAAEESPAKQEQEDSSPRQSGVQNDVDLENFQQDSWPLLPTKTLRIDLTKTEKELWNNLDSDAKYSIRKAEKHLSAYCIQLSALEKEKEKEKELRKFHRVLKDAGKRQGYPTPNWQDIKNLAECFGEKGWLITATVKQQHQQRKFAKPTPIVNPPQEKPPRLDLQKPRGLGNAAGCVLLTHKNTAYYHHAATTKEGRDLLAGYLVLWEALRLAKEQGCLKFDFEGIYDERYHKRTKAWKGFTYFKKKFGGKEIIYPQPVIKYYSRLFHTMNKIFN